MFVSIILKFLGGTFLGRLGEPILKFFIYAIPIGLLAFGGYKTVTHFTTLESQNNILEAKVSVLTDDLRVAKAEKKTEKQSSDVNIALVHSNDVAIVKEDKKLDTAIKTRDKKIEEVKIKFSKDLSARVDSNKEPTVEDKTMLEEQISTIQINALWDAYCDGENKSKEQCKIQKS